MTYEQTGDGFGPASGNWVTIKGPDVYHFLNDGTCLQLIADDHDTPSYWSAEWVDVQGQVHDDIHPDHFPMRAGGLEWCRAWIAKRGLHTVPTDEQKAAPWYRFRAGGEHDQDRARQLHTPFGRKKPDADAETAAKLAAEVQQAVEMAQAIDMAMKIDLAMRTAPALPAITSPTVDDAVDCPTCNGFGFVGHPDDPAGKCGTCDGAGAIPLSKLMASIDAKLVGPSYSCPQCKSTFGTPVCPECGGIAQKVA